MVTKQVKRFIYAVLFLVFYFIVFINFAPQVLSFIEAFVTANKSMFTFNVVLKEFIVVNNTVIPQDKYVTIDLSIFMIFLSNFAFYVIIPFSVLFIFVRG